MTGGFVLAVDADACPCGSGAAFGLCCGPILAGAPASSPEVLMRSRYTAFVVGDASHLVETWHPGTRPDAVDPDPAVRWQRLEIVEASGAGDAEKRGNVEFRAHYRSRELAGRLGPDRVQHERSRFVRQSGRWWYLDGEVLDEE